jgi:hypothetical protein
MVKILLYWIVATFLHEHVYYPSVCYKRVGCGKQKKTYKTHCNEETARVAIKLIRNRRL